MYGILYFLGYYKSKNVSEYTLYLLNWIEFVSFYMEMN